LRFFLPNRRKRVEEAHQLRFFLPNRRKRA